MKLKLKFALAFFAILSFVLTGSNLEDSNQTKENTMFSETTASWNKEESASARMNSFSNLNLQYFLNGFVDVKTYHSSIRRNMFFSAGIANTAGTPYFSNITDHGLYVEEESTRSLFIEEWYVDWQESHAAIEPTMYIVELPEWDNRKTTWRNCHKYVKDEYSDSFDEFINSELLVAKIDPDGNATTYRNIEVLPGEGFTACRIVRAGNESIDLSNFFLSGINVGIQFDQDQYAQFQAAARYRNR